MCEILLKEHLKMKSEIIGKIINSEELNKDFWITTDSFNLLLREAEGIRLSEDGIWEICFKYDTLGVERSGVLMPDNKVPCHIRVMYIKDEHGNYHYNAENCFKHSEKKCELL